MSASTYTISYTRQAQKFLEKAQRDLRARLLAACESLALNPRPYGAIKLEGRDTYRIREGDYRIEYTIFDRELWVDIVKIDHRKDIYR